MKTKEPKVGNSCPCPKCHGTLVIPIYDGGCFKRNDPCPICKPVRCSKCEEDWALPGKICSTCEYENENED